MTDWINYYWVLKGRFDIAGGLCQVCYEGLSVPGKGRTAVVTPGTKSQIPYCSIISQCA